MEAAVLVSVEPTPHHGHRASPVRFSGKLQGMDGSELVVTHATGHVIAVANRVCRQALHYWVHRHFQKVGVFQEDVLKLEEQHQLVARDVEEIRLPVLHRIPPLLPTSGLPILRHMGQSSITTALPLRQRLIWWRNCHKVPRMKPSKSLAHIMLVVYGTNPPIIPTW